MLRRLARNFTGPSGLIGLPIWLLAAAAVASPVVCMADASVRERAVDVVLLKEGTRLLGVVLPTSTTATSTTATSTTATDDEEHVTMLLRAAWFKENQPELYDECLAQEPDSEPATSVQSLLKDHLLKLQDEANPDVRRITFLTEELNAIQPHEAADAEPDVLLLTIPKKRIRRQMLKKSNVRRLAGLGILNLVETTETAKATDLKKVLQEIDQANLVQDVPGLSPDNADSDLQQILLHADRMIGKTSRLVFFNGTWLSEASAAENPQAMMLQMMTGGLQSQLQQLLNETAGPQPGRPAKQSGLPDVLPPKAVALAKSEEADAVEVRSMKLNPGSGTATVQIAVYWQPDDEGPWKKIQQVSASAGPSDVTAESQQRILQDERVKEAVGLISELGFGSGQLNSALAMGSVVESASSRAEQRLSQALQPAGATTASGLKVLRTTLTAE